MRLLPFAAFVSVALVACSSSTTSGPTDGGSDGASSADGSALADGTTSTEVATGDGGCLLPTEGAACTTADKVCPVTGDICCIGYVWMCTAGKWTKAGLGCPCQPPPQDTGSVADVTAD